MSEEIKLRPAQAEFIKQIDLQIADLKGQRTFALQAMLAGLGKDVRNIKNLHPSGLVEFKEED